MKRIYFENTREMLAALEEQKKVRGDAYAGSSMWIFLVAVIDVFMIPFVFWHNLKTQTPSKGQSK